MERIIWSAEATEEEWEQLTEQDLDDICDDLDIYFKQLVEELLAKKVAP